MFLGPHDQGVRRVRRPADVGGELDGPRRSGVDVLVGAPEVWNPSRFLRLRSQGDRVERVGAGCVQRHIHISIHATRSLRQRHRVGAARVWALPGVVGLFNAHTLPFPISPFTDACP